MPCIHERMARVRLVVEQQVEQQSSAVAPACRHSRAIYWRGPDSLIIEADLGH